MTVAERMNVPVVRSRTDRVVRWIERGLIVAGATCLIWVGTSSLSAAVYQMRQSVLLEQWDSVGGGDAEGGRPLIGMPVDPGAAVGRLEIPRIGLSAVVAAGDDEKTLAVAVGHLPDTPLPWQEGNSVLAGHRDSFFRPLQRISTGDEIRFATRRGTFRYRVTRHTVVAPDELWVLDAPPTAALTLITCYPFDFIGPAPRRFVVHAERIADAGESVDTSAVQGNGTP
jgi:sortase A